MLKSLLNLILIVLLFISTLGYVASQLVKPGFMANQAEKVHLYEQATAQIGTVLPKDTLKDVALSATEIQEVLTKSIDASTFYTTLNDVSNAYANYLTGRSETLKYSINLAPTKSKLRNAATAALIAKYQGLTICKTTELKTWDASNSFPTCQLPSTNVQSKDVDSLLGIQVDKMLSNLPDSWNAPTPTKSLIELRARVSQIVHLIKIAWLTTIGFILLYILILRKRAFMPLALIFLVVGVLEVAFSILAWDWLKRLITDLIVHPDTPQQAITMTGLLVDDIIQTLKTVMGNLSIITLSAGGLFLILWGFTRFSRSKSKEPALEVPKN